MTDPALPSSLETTRSLGSRFEAIVDAYPQNVACSDQTRRWTYRELNREANRIANHLIALDLPHNSIVAIWLDRSVYSAAAMLGVLKAGHAYLPLEATYPVARIAQTLDDAQPALLISEPALETTLPQHLHQVIFLDEFRSSPSINPEIHVPSSSVAYVMYTSGSTGKPKGVLVTHANVSYLLHHMHQRFHFTAQDVFTWFHSFAFDFSIMEMWPPLLCGAAIVVVPYETSRSPSDFYRLVSTERVTILCQTPTAFSLFNQVEEQGPQLPLAVRVLFLGGEALAFSALRSWFGRHSDTFPLLVNSYGPTEVSVASTFREITLEDARNETESIIGKPLPFLQAYLIDEMGNLLGECATGELCVAGPAVSLGYLNRPELTAERFLPAPLAAGSSLMYRTGDLVRRRPSGDLVYLGRRDEQVKISGFRIELYEVEAAVAAFPGVVQVCVAPFVTGGRTTLAAYFVADTPTAVQVSRLAAHLTRTLPPQMLPSFYTRLESIPVMGSGKADRKALPPPSREHSVSAYSSAHQPASEIEQSVLDLVRQTVGDQRIALSDNFFAVGGHSLLGTQFVVRARKAFGIKLALRHVFEADDVAALAQCIEALILEEIDNLSEDEAQRLMTESAA